MLPSQNHLETAHYSLQFHEKPIGSALSLLVTLVTANNAHHATTADHLAIAADLLDRGLYFHFFKSPLIGGCLFMTDSRRDHSAGQTAPRHTPKISLFHKAIVLM